MKKDVVGMDRPRSEEELADLAWIRQSEVLSDLEQRVARLEKYRVDYVQVCTRVARLEERLFNDDLNALREGLLPWGDLD